MSFLAVAAALIGSAPFYGDDRGWYTPPREAQSPESVAAAKARAEEKRARRRARNQKNSGGERGTQEEPQD